MSSESTDVQEMYARAVAYQRAGRLDEAEQLCRAVVDADPRHADALFLLGALSVDGGRLDAAVEWFRRAATWAPENALFQMDLGEAYRRTGRALDATHAFLRALMLDPRRAEPVFNLGLILDAHDLPDLALACFEQAATLKPASPLIHQRLARARERWARAHQTAGLPTAAPSRVAQQILLALAKHLHQTGQSDRALELLRRAQESGPSAAALSDAGAILRSLGRHDEAIAHVRRSLELEPANAIALSNLAIALIDVGQVSEAVDTFRRSLAVQARPRTHSNLLFAMAFDPRSTGKSILAEAAEFDRRHARPLAAQIAAHRNDPSPERRLRIGYVSGDFRGHCQALFTTPLLAHHDHQRVEIFCYSSVARPDAYTERLRGYADGWRNLVGVDEERAAERIRQDGIDVLVDLTMHMEGCQPLLFARRPAPVQVCWLAYPGTTGLATMDYRLSDPHLDPPDVPTDAYSEQTIRLPDSFWCYAPLVDDVSVGPLPALARGHITFGCLNNFAKVHGDVLALWARTMRAVRGSRLILHVPEGQSRARVCSTLAEHGIDRSAVEMVGRRSQRAYLESYRQIDVCLDTFPYNGHTTSLDALWMGVPVVTLVGDTVVGRAGLCHAENLGLPELVATSADAYVKIAADLCSDLDRLAALRQSLRARMVTSPLMDAPRFARHIEDAYRAMWRRWCATRAASL